MGPNFTTRLKALQYGKGRLDSVQLHNRWSIRVEEREVGEWTPAPEVTDAELGDPAITRRMR